MWQRQSGLRIGQANNWSIFSGQNSIHQSYDMVRYMLKMGTSGLYRLLVMGILFTVAASLLGCDSSMEGYRAFTFNKVAQFSFEYPRHYRKYAASATVENRTVAIGFVDKIPSQGCTNGFITVIIEGVGDTYPDATVALEDEISQFVEPKNLMERSTTTVAGIQAELLVYSHDFEVIPDPGCGSFGAIRVKRVVYFDYNELIWEVVIESDEDRADVAEADFEHLLETFQILD